MKKILLTGYVLLLSTFCFSQYILSADTTVSGTWNLNAGWLKVLPGVKIHGTGTVTNYRMDAYPDQSIFDTTLNFSGIIGAKDNKPSAIWFGVKTSNANNTRYFQRAIDACINKNFTLYIPSGIYVDSTQIVISSFYSGDYQPCQLNIEGDYRMNGALIGTMISYKGNGGCAIGIQQGKGITIKGLYIQGKFVSPSQSNLTNYYNTTYANYTDANGVVNTYHSGIIIDCFENPTGSISGSTVINIENCSIGGFTNCINISPTSTLNAELVTITYCSFGACRTCVQSNDGQEKVNIIEHCMAWDAAFCFFQAGFINAQSGYYHITDINIAGRVSTIFYVNQYGWFPLKADHIYAESIASIGTLLTNAMGIEISASTFQFEDPAIIGTHYLAYTNNVNTIFRSCDFTFFNGRNGMQLPFNGIQTFDACSFDGVYSNTATGSVFYPNCHFRN